MEPAEVQPAAEPEAKDEWPFPEFALEEIDPPILPWRKRKPVEPWRPARTDANDAG